VKIIYVAIMAGLMAFALSCQSGIQSLASKFKTKSTASYMRVADTKSTTLRRLESITWNSVNHELSWDVSKGQKDGEQYKPKGNDRYEINMDKATMTVNGESRRFSSEEAANVRILMDFISKYALESTVWWENGEGDPMDKNAPERPSIPDKGKDKEKEGTIGSKNIHIVNMLMDFGK
jgi:hypothetical protein